MSFCWFTSFIGYPNFLKTQGSSFDLGQAFITLAQASLNSKTYSESKELFPNLDPAQVETKKAAFQEFGLLYVIPRSNTITLTPLGFQLYDLLSKRQVLEENRRTVLLLLCHSLARYQFNNPLPVGGKRKVNTDRAKSSDVLPYLACYYLLLKLDGLLTVSELRGAIFSLQTMSELRYMETTILNQRKKKQSFSDIADLPTNPRTADNLKIYFMAHLSLDWEILESTTANYYGAEEQAFELTEFGYELVKHILDEQWVQWQSQTSHIPNAKNYQSIDDYFINGVGKQCSTHTTNEDASQTDIVTVELYENILDSSDLEKLKELPRRTFQEAKKRLVQHTRIEKIRNSSLIREAKKLFREEYGRLFCEVCLFDFEIQYGQRGKDYIEAHHKMPIAELEEEVELTANDLTMVCSNCHRMLHRPPWITVHELIDLINNISENEPFSP